MKFPFSAALVAAALLLGTLGCAKKDDPAASTSGTGSYKLDGTTISCQSKAYVSTSTSGGLSSDYLQINLTTTPQPSSGAETLRLYFYKQTSQPTTAYVLTDIAFYTKGSTAAYYTFANDVTTLTGNSSSGFSGTFSAKATSSTTMPSPYAAITAGVFTNAQL